MALKCHKSGNISPSGEKPYSVFAGLRQIVKGCFYSSLSGSVFCVHVICADVLPRRARAVPAASAGCALMVPQHPTSVSIALLCFHPSL